MRHLLRVILGKDETRRQHAKWVAEWNTMIDELKCSDWAKSHLIVKP